MEKVGKILPNPAMSGRWKPIAGPNNEATYKCWHCQDLGRVYLPIKDKEGRSDTTNPMFGKAMPCLWCARIPDGTYYRDTTRGKAQLDLMEQLGCEVPG